jgi:hypothetical protein
LEEEALLSQDLLSGPKLPTARVSPKTWFMKKLLIYLSVIGVSLAILPIQAEAGSARKKKDRIWASHHGYSSREHYRYYYSRYHRYYGYQRYPYWYYGYGGCPGIGFSLQFD